MKAEGPKKDKIEETKQDKKVVKAEEPKKDKGRFGRVRAALKSIRERERQKVVETDAT